MGEMTIEETEKLNILEDSVELKEIIEEQDKLLDMPFGIIDLENVERIDVNDSIKMQ